MKNFVADCRCQNNQDANAAIRAYAATVTPEKCNNWIDHLKNYVNMHYFLFVMDKIIFLIYLILYQIGYTDSYS